MHGHEKRANPRDKEPFSGTAAFRRTFIKTLDAEKYGISVADYFLARAA